jgi:hypothetical protein
MLSHLTNRKYEPTAVTTDIRMFKPHLFIPRILKRPNSKRKEVSGYPNRLKNKVAKTIVPKKRINCIGDSEDSGEDSFFTAAALPWKKTFETKMPDKIMRSIPRSKENMPLLAIRKVPMGIFRERIVVINPKRKITAPTIASSLFTHFPRGFQTCLPCTMLGSGSASRQGFQISLVPAQEHGNKMKIKDDCLTQFQMSDSEAIKPHPARK